MAHTEFNYVVQLIFCCFFFVCLFNSVSCPFQDYFSSYETGQSVGVRKRENSEKKHLAHPQAELGLSHVARAGFASGQCGARHCGLFCFSFHMDFLGDSIILV